MFAASGQLIYAQNNLNERDSLKLGETDTLKVNYAIKDTIAVRETTEKIRDNSTKEYYVKGFRHFWEFEYAHDCEHHDNYFSMLVTLGYQFNSYLYLGGGTGYMEGRYVLESVLFFPVELRSSKFVPTFADVRITLSKKKIVPYFDLKTGYNIGIHRGRDGQGFYFCPSIGIKDLIPSKRKIVSAATLSVGYSNYDFFNCFNIKLGLEL